MSKECDFSIDKECIHSLNLELSMNNQCRMLNVEEHLRYQESIDKKDDERRDQNFKLDKWNENMMKSFNKNLKQAIESKDWDLVAAIQKKVETFQRDYFKKRKTLQELELNYEELDDDIRIWLLEYVVSCIEKNRDESEKINLKWITETIEKKKEKKARLNH